MARQCVRALEAAALAENDPRVTAVASAALAAVCAAAAGPLTSTNGRSNVGAGASMAARPVGMGGGTSGGRGGDVLTPLPVYPADGAARPLVEALLDR